MDMLERESLYKEESRKICQKIFIPESIFFENTTHQQTSLEHQPYEELLLHE